MTLPSWWLSTSNHPRLEWLGCLGRGRRRRPHENSRRSRQWHRGNEASWRIAEIPGVGVLGATAVVASMGSPGTFPSGREFAAWLGLVPRHRGTAGRVLLLGIGKRGDTYLRTLLIRGARSVPFTSTAPPGWALRVATCRPLDVAVAALANIKVARTLWALLARDRFFRPDFAGSSAWRPMGRNTGNQLAR